MTDGEVSVCLGRGERAKGAEGGSQGYASGS